jgi:hypothetical protein
MSNQANHLAPVPKYNLVRKPDVASKYKVIQDTPVELHYWPYKN